MLKQYRVLALLFFLTLMRVYSFCGAYNCIDTSAGSSNNSLSESNLIKGIRDSASANVRKYLPSPHSELLLGMLLGIDDLKKTPRYNDVLKVTGTIHVVVVSGYNISLVFGIVIGIIGSQYKFKNLVLAEIVTLIYAVISGFGPPVIRAWIMGSIAAWGKYYGRRVEAAALLVFSGLLLVFADPLFLFSLSFQLSFMATLSLVCYSDIVSGEFYKLSRFKKTMLLDDFCTTLSAQVLVWPIISYTFGRVSLVSPFVNALILWTVPLSTVLGGIFLLFTYLSPFISALLRYFLYVPLDIFVSAVDLFSKSAFSSTLFKMNGQSLAIYYLIVFCLPFVYKPAPGGKLVSET